VPGMLCTFEHVSANLARPCLQICPPASFFICLLRMLTPDSAGLTTSPVGAYSLFIRSFSTPIDVQKVILVQLDYTDCTLARILRMIMRIWSSRS
jgi:hypothetical protein